MLADDQDQLTPHKTGEHGIYLFSKNLAANFTPTTNRAGSSPHFLSAESSESSALNMLTGKDQHKLFKKRITPQIRTARAQKSSAQKSSVGSFKGKQNFEPLPLITMFFSVMRHREKTNKSGSTGEQQAVSGLTQNLSQEQGRESKSTGPPQQLVAGEHFHQ